MNTCQINGCMNPSAARSWCRKHYMRWWRHKDTDFLGKQGRPKLNVGVCIEANCRRAQRTQHLCGAHYQAMRRSKL